MRIDFVALGFVLTLFSTTLVQGQVTVDVSKVTCDQFAQGKVGLPRTTAVWLNGYYHGKKVPRQLIRSSLRLFSWSLWIFAARGKTAKCSSCRRLSGLWRGRNKHGCHQQTNRGALEIHPSPLPPADPTPGGAGRLDP